MKKYKLFLLGIKLIFVIIVFVPYKTIAQELVGNGLKQHSFVYVGEYDTRNPTAQSMYVVKNGKVVWHYSIPLRTLSGSIQEFDDVTMLSNGNIVFACMSGAGIITPEKNIIWQYTCAPGTETHSCQPIGKDSVLLVVNGNPAKVLIVNTASNKILKEIIIPTTSTNTHVQFRHVRISQSGTLIIPLMGENRVAEFTLEGNEIWSVTAAAPWSAIRLHDGNTLISGNQNCYTREVNNSGETIWEVTQKDVPFKLYNNQTANRLANGNTVISNWFTGEKNKEELSSSVQVFEITRGKKIVWALSSWKKPDLGPNTYIQLLDEPGNPDNGELQR